MFRVRLRTIKDAVMVTKWWEEKKLSAPSEGMIPEHTTWICEFDSVPVIQLSLIITNTEVAWLEGLVGSPEFRGPVRRLATKFIVAHATKFAVDNGYEKLFCVTSEVQLKSYYESFGFVATNQVYMMAKEI